MLRRILAVCLVAGLGSPPQLAHGQSAAADADMANGIRQVREGDFDAALITLDGVVKRLSGQQGQAKELARAYTYLAIAYVGLAQQETARAKFLAAWKADRNMTLSPKEFPPNIIQFFEEAKKEAEGKAGAEAKPPATTPGPAPSPVATTASAEKKGGGHTGLIILGVGGAAAAGIAIAAAGKGGGASTRTTVPPSASLADLSASVSSPQFNSNINCTDNISATVNIRNSAASSVTVTGVRADKKVTFGTCVAPAPFVFTPIVSSVGPGASATVLNRPLTSGGAGCCSPGNACNGGTFCQFLESFTVITGIGEVSAGSIGYGITYRGCSACASSAPRAFQCPSAP